MYLLEVDRAGRNAFYLEVDRDWKKGKPTVP